MANNNLYTDREAARRAATLQRQKMQKLRESAGSVRASGPSSMPSKTKDRNQTKVQSGIRSKKQSGVRSKSQSSIPSKIQSRSVDYDMDAAVVQELKRRRKVRRLISFGALMAVVVGLGYFGFYYFTADRTASLYESATTLRDARRGVPTVNIHKTDEEGVPDILEEYSLLYSTHRNLIGWLKIEDTAIDYPVMQLNNEFYLDHNYKGDKDKNGALFLDESCDVVKPSDNLIIYGHHMKSGNMFGALSQYASEDYWKAHSRIEFDSIYEKGVYEVMYVFQETLKDSAEVTFKYYQFINANSPDEFASNMRAMEGMSMYNTGVTAAYGDRLITLSTCDHSATDGRFVVVAKKVG